MSGGIYAIQRKDSDECYIGSAVKVAQRWAEHRSDLRNGKHCSRYLQRVHDKHGAGALEFVILEPVADKADLLAREQVWLDKFRPAYNTATVAGSCLGVKHSDEARANMSAAGMVKAFSDKHRANIGAAGLGRRHSAETRAKMSSGRRGRVHSAETRAKISASKLGQGAGLPRSAETRARISAANRGAANSNAKLTAEKVAAIRADTRLHRVIAAEYGVNPSRISGIRRGNGWRHTA